MLSPNVQFYLGKTRTNSRYLLQRIYPKKFQELELSIPTHKARSLWTLDEKRHIHREFHRSNRESIYSLLLLPPDEENNQTSAEVPRTDTVLQWGSEFDFLQQHFTRRHRQGLFEYHNVWGVGMKDEAAIKHHQENATVRLSAWTISSMKPKVIHEHNLCHAFINARDIAGFETPHILITHLNENWGALSSYVRNRTANWGGLFDHWEQDSRGPCNAIDIKKLYLDSPNTLAVFTTQHQSVFDHPKVHSIPIGVADSQSEGEELLRNLAKQQEKYKNSTISRPKLLMINNARTEERTPQVDAVLRNFQQSGHPQGKEARNTYNTYEGHDQRNQYLNEIWSSKFIMCPSGLGWDSYRVWEAITLGAIPVIERHKYKYEQITYPSSSGKTPKLIERPTGKDRKKLHEHLSKHNATLTSVTYYDGWQRSLDDLPVVWINGTFGDHLTPEFLEEQYDIIAALAGEFHYEKMTSLYWLQFMESFLVENRSEGSLRRHALDTLSDTFNNHSNMVEYE